MNKNTQNREMREQAETEALMDTEVELATDCGPDPAKQARKHAREEKQQVDTEALMDAEVEAATDCGCGCGCSKK